MKILTFSFQNPLDDSTNREELEKTFETLTDCKNSISEDGKTVAVTITDETGIFTVTDNLVAGAAAVNCPVEPRPVIKENDEEETKKKMPRIPLTVFVAVVCLSIMAAVLLTSAFFIRLYKPAINLFNPGNSGTEDKALFSELTTFDRFFKTYGYSPNQLSDEEMTSYLLKAYVSATGDKYAYYYDAEEYDQQKMANVATGVGMGVNIMSNELEYKGEDLMVLQVTRVYEGSPAYKAGVRLGDCIAWSGIGESRKSLSDFSTFAEATATLRAEKEGDTISFTALRHDGDSYKEIEFNVAAKVFVAPPVSGRVSTTNPEVGIIDIVEFNLTTPRYLKQSMNQLIEQGITEFVIDLRENPGGDLKSIIACLSYFLEDNQLILRIRDRDGNAKDEFVSVRYNSGLYADCSVRPEEIGMYSKYRYAIIVNGGTASAAELFTAAFRDYDLAKIVGEKTYGKGCMQNQYDLSAFHIPGALRLTTNFYDPPSLVNYDGIKISPSEGYAVELPEAYETTYYTLIPEAEDTQMAAAISSFVS